MNNELSREERIARLQAYLNRCCYGALMIRLGVNPQHLRWQKLVD